jgi:hypothetical protein
MPTLVEIPGSTVVHCGYTWVLIKWIWVSRRGYDIAQYLQAERTRNGRWTNKMIRVDFNHVGSVLASSLASSSGVDCEYCVVWVNSKHVSHATFALEHLASRQLRRTDPLCSKLSRSFDYPTAVLNGCWCAFLRLDLLIISPT